VLNRVARRVATAVLAFSTTSDFVVFVQDPEFDENLAENISFSATPDALAELRANNLLPQPWREPE
jgi:hypothetical protein